MKNKAFIKGAIILVIFNLVGKVIGALYRIPLARIIGGEGMGQYQLIFPLYCLFLTISTSGVPVAISKLIAEFNERGQRKNARKLLRIAVAILLAVSLICAAVLVVFAKNISALQGNREIYICYYAIAPATVFVGILSAFRGYFQGNLRMFPSALSGLVEQIVKLVVGLLLAKKFLEFGVVYAVFGAVVGISISELAALLVLVTIYIFSKRASVAASAPPSTRRELFSRLIKISVPVTLGGLISPATSMIDSFLVINLLMFGGLTSSYATSLLGLQAGVVEPLINLPVVIAVSISVALLPSLSGLVASGNREGQRHIISKTFETTLIISLAAGICYIIFGRQILNILYGNFSGAELLISTKLLFLSCINVVALSLVQVSASVLQGLGYAGFTVKSLLVGCSIKLALTIGLVMIPAVNIYGVVISGGVSFLLVFALNYRKIKKLSGVSILSSLTKIAVLQAMVALFAFSTNLLFKLLFSDLVSLALAGGSTVLVFGLVYYFLFICSETEINVAGLEKEVEK